MSEGVGSQGSVYRLVQAPCIDQCTTAARGSLILPVASDVQLESYAIVQHSGEGGNYLLVSNCVNHPRSDTSRSMAVRLDSHSGYFTGPSQVYIKRVRKTPLAYSMVNAWRSPSRSERLSILQTYGHQL